MLLRYAIALLLFSRLSVPVAAQNILQDSLRDLRLDDSWIYDDWGAARKLADKEGKPIFTVFRCVP